MPRSAPAGRASGAPDATLLDRGLRPARTPYRRRSRGPHAPLRSGGARLARDCDLLYDREASPAGLPIAVARGAHAPLRSGGARLCGAPLTAPT